MVKKRFLVKKKEGLLKKMGISFWWIRVLLIKSCYKRKKIDNSFFFVFFSAMDHDGEFMTWWAEDTVSCCSLLPSPSLCTGACCFTSALHLLWLQNMYSHRSNPSGRSCSFPIHFPWLAIPWEVPVAAHPSRYRRSSHPSVRTCSSSQPMALTAGSQLLSLVPCKGFTNPPSPPTWYRGKPGKGTIFMNS